MSLTVIDSNTLPSVPVRRPLQHFPARRLTLVKTAEGGVRSPGKPFRSEAPTLPSIQSGRKLAPVINIAWHRPGANGGRGTGQGFAWRAGRLAARHRVTRSGLWLTFAAVTPPLVWIGHAALRMLRVD